MKLSSRLRLLSALALLVASQTASANPELEIADRGTVPSCSITDALPAYMAKRAAEIGYVREELVPSTVTASQFGGRLRCAKTLDGRGKVIGVAMVEDFVREGTKIRALYQGDSIIFSLSGVTPAATYPTRKGEFRCYRGGGAAVVQCTTGFGMQDAGMLVLQNQNEDYSLGLTVSKYGWSAATGRPLAAVTLKFGDSDTMTGEWVNQSLSDPDDVGAWTASFEGRAFTETLLKLTQPVKIDAQTSFVVAEPASQVFDSGEMIALYKAMALLTREMPGG